MSTIKSSDEHLTINADGSGKDIKFQANGVEKASISSAGAFTSTTIDATKLTGDLPAISGANLTGVADATKVPLAGGTMTGNLLVESSASANTVVRSKGTAADGYRHGFEAVNGHTGGETWSMFSTNNSDSVFSGGKLVFSTGAAGSASASTSKLQITSDGRGLSNFTAKAWVRFNGQSTPSIQGSHNVSSITDNGTGLYTVNYSNNMTGTNYTVTTTQENYSWDTVVKVTQPADVLAGSCKLAGVRVVNNNYEDSRVICMAVFGGQ